MLSACARKLVSKGPLGGLRESSDLVRVHSTVKKEFNKNFIVLVCLFPENKNRKKSAVLVSIFYVVFQIWLG